MVTLEFGERPSTLPLPLPPPTHPPTQIDPVHVTVRQQAFLLEKQDRNAYRSALAGHGGHHLVNGWPKQGAPRKDGGKMKRTRQPQSCAGKGAVVGGGPNIVQGQVSFSAFHFPQPANVWSKFGGGGLNGRGLWGKLRSSYGAVATAVGGRLLAVGMGVGGWVLGYGLPLG